MQIEYSQLHVVAVINGGGINFNSGAVKLDGCGVDVDECSVDVNNIVEQADGKRCDQVDEHSWHCGVQLVQRCLNVLPVCLRLVLTCLLPQQRE
jgi:hypothetical protein